MSSRRRMGAIIRTDNARGHDSEAHKDYAARSRVEELAEKTFRSGEKC
jgi:hypothetical protein